MSDEPWNGRRALSLANQLLVGLGRSSAISASDLRVLSVLAAASLRGGDEDLTDLCKRAIRTEDVSDVRAVVEAVVRKHANVRHPERATWIVSGSGPLRAFISGLLVSLTEVVRFDRGADVLGRLRSAQDAPGLIILDASLTDGSGLDLLARLRSDVTIEARVLVVGPAEIYGEARALGAQIVVPDPTEHSAELTTVLEAMLGMLSGVGIELGVDPTNSMMSMPQLRAAFEMQVDACATLRKPGWTVLVVEPTARRLIRAHFAGFASAVLSRLEGVLAAGATDSGRLVVLLDTPDATDSVTALRPVSEDEVDFSGLLGLDDTLPEVALTGCVGCVATWREVESVFDWPTIPPNQNTQLPVVGRSAGHTVLLAEDSAVTASYVTTVLAQLGLAVVLRRTGKGVQELIRDDSVTNISVVLLDLYLPGADGLQLLDELRRSPRYANTPVMLITSSEEARHHVAALQAGADDFLVKPVSPAVLQERVRRVLARSNRGMLGDDEVTESISRHDPRHASL